MTSFNLKEMQQDAAAILTCDYLEHEQKRDLLWLRKSDKSLTPEEMRELHRDIQDDKNRFRVKAVNDRQYDKSVAMKQSKQVRDVKRKEGKHVNPEPVKRKRGTEADDRIARVMQTINAAMRR